MVERYQPAKPTPIVRFRPTKPLVRPGGNYFPRSKKSLTFIPSGCAVLDCVTGGGWPLGRISNIVGDKSAGKTLLAIEACANFAHSFPQGRIYYREAEAAFDEEYAVKLGLPVDRVDFGKEGLGTSWDTVEDIFEDIERQLTAAEKSGKPGLYIVDSLDALSDRGELARKVDEATYGAEKAKLMSKLFRTHTRRIKAAKFHIMIISQLRDKLNVKFGEKQGRTGGRALDFYASQVLWMIHLKTLTRTIEGQKRATAIRALAKCKKNKIAMPFRECEFTIRFGYGVDDLEASLDWLAEVKMLDRLGLKVSGVDSYLNGTTQLSPQERQRRSAEVREIVLEAWEQVEAKFLPESRKYA